MAKIDPGGLLEICNYCLFDSEANCSGICINCGVVCSERGRNYFVPKDMNLMAALEIVERVFKERREDA